MNRESSLPGSIPPPDAAFIQAEAARRNRMWSPEARVRAVEENNAWAEAQLSGRRNSKAECLRKQAMLLKALSAVRAS